MSPSKALPDHGPEQKDDGLASSGSGWRPIHYLGSKLRVLPTVQEAIDSVSSSGSAACDLFAGSGTVSAWLAQSRRVTSVDIQEYSKIICGALLNPVELPIPMVRENLSKALDTSKASGGLRSAMPMIELEEKLLRRAADGDPEGLASLIEAGPILTSCADRSGLEIGRALLECRRRLDEPINKDPRSTMALRHFGGVYFSYRQAAELDAILDAANHAPLEQRVVLVAAALATASEIVNTVGKQFAQPLRPRDKHGQVKKSLYSQSARDRYKNTFEIYLLNLEKFSNLKASKFDNRAIRSDYSDFLSSPEFHESVVYADPPYTRDHYSRFYHVLETLALRDDPKISTNTAHGKTGPSRGVYRMDRHQSPFCIRSQAPLAFEKLFAKVAERRVPLVLSYSPYASEKNAHPRVMTIDQIRSIATSFFARVDVESVGEFSHSRLNRKDLNKEVSFDAEYLFVCR